MLDEVLYLLYSHGLVFIVLLLMVKFALFSLWQSSQKKYAHFFYINNKYIINNSINDRREIVLIKAQNILFAVLLISAFFWLLLKLLFKFV